MKDSVIKKEKSEHPSRFSSPADLRLLQDTYGRLDGRCTAMLAALEAQTP